ncbi:MAG: tetratricopeptide repeat protein, partial [Bryobacteraceae bacterium]
YSLRGLAYSYSGQHGRAIEDQNRAIEMNPKGSAASYNDRGWAYVELGQPEKALEDLNKAIQMAPDFQKAYENRAMAYARLKEYARAISDLTAAMQLNPTPWQYQKRAEARRASGDAKGAEEDLRQAGEIGGTRLP